MCNANWSGRDEFFYFSTCHVWNPLYLILNLICVVYAGANLVYSIKRLARGPNYVVKFVVWGSTPLVLYYVARLVTNWTLGDRYIILNLVSSIGFGFYWLAALRILFQYLQVMLLNDKIQGKTEGMLPAAKTVFQGAMVFCFGVEVGCLALPCLAPTLAIFPAYPSFILVRVNLVTGIFVYFIYQIRKILVAEPNQGYYTELKQEIDRVLLIWLVILCVFDIFLAVAISDVTLQMNQYIVLPLITIGFESICLASAWLSKQKKFRDPNQIRVGLSLSDAPGKKNSVSVSTSSVSRGGFGAPLIESPTPSSPYRSHHHNNTYSHSSLPSPHTPTHGHGEHKEIKEGSRRKIAIPEEDPEHSILSASQVEGGGLGSEDSTIRRESKNENNNNNNHKAIDIQPSGGGRKSLPSPSTNTPPLHKYSISLKEGQQAQPQQQQQQQQPQLRPSVKEAPQQQTQQVELVAITPPVEPDDSVRGQPLVTSESTVDKQKGKEGHGHDHDGEVWVQ